MAFVFFARSGSVEHDGDLLSFNTDPARWPGRLPARLRPQSHPRRCTMLKRFEILPPALPKEVPDYHERQASHCRALAASAPSFTLKARLLQEAEAHEKIASGNGEIGAVIIR